MNTASAGAEALDLGRILVDAGDGVAEVGEAGAGNQADIACSDHGDAHGEGSLEGRRRTPDTEGIF